MTKRHVEPKPAKHNLRGLFFAVLWIAVFVSLVTVASLAHDTGAAAISTKLAGDTVRIDMVMEGGNGHGSGVHIGNGYILTVAHVAHPGPEMTPFGPQPAPVMKELDVVTDDGNSQPAEVLWANNEYDVALIKIKDWKGIKSARIANRAPVIGEPVEVVGYPLWLPNTQHTFGKVASDIATMPAAMEKREFFSVTANVAPGNSGGPVFDANHEVLGLADAVPMTGTGQDNGLGLIVSSKSIEKMLARI